MASALEDYVDITEAAVGPTRGDRSIDRLFTNFGRSIKQTGTLPSLETDEDGERKRLSDHLIAYVGADMPGRGPGTKLTYSYRYFEKEAAQGFKDWTISQNWSDVYQAGTSNGKADAYQALINGALDLFFPRKTTMRNSSDPPWINGAVKKRIKQRDAPPSGNA